MMLETRKNPLSIEAFKDFLSDKNVQSPKRGDLFLHKMDTRALEMGNLRDILRAQIHAFKNAVQQAKLFQRIEVNCSWAWVIKQLAVRVQEEKILKLVRVNTREERYSRVFHIAHPKLEGLMLEVKFEKKTMKLHLIYKWSISAVILFV